MIWGALPSLSFVWSTRPDEGGESFFYEIHHLKWEVEYLERD
jgi:hypothetical protein